MRTEKILRGTGFRKLPSVNNRDSQRITEFSHTLPLTLSWFLSVSSKIFYAIADASLATWWIWINEIKSQMPLHSYVLIILTLTQIDICTQTTLLTSNSHFLVLKTHFLLMQLSAIHPRQDAECKMFLKAPIIFLLHSAPLPCTMPCTIVQICNKHYSDVLKDNWRSDWKKGGNDNCISKKSKCYIPMNISGGTWQQTLNCCLITVNDEK